MNVSRFDWEVVFHKSISAVVARNERVMSDGSLSWDELSLMLDEGAIILTVNTDTDEIAVAYEAALEGDGWKVVASLAHAVGKPLGWCWMGTNYRGYHDSFILALGDVVPHALEPRLMFLGESSAISCFDLKPVTA